MKLQANSQIRWTVWGVVLLFFLAGCATPLTKGELSEIPSIVIVRSVPDIFFVSKNIAPSSSGVGQSASSVKADLPLQETSLLIVDKFIEKVHEKIPYWPKMEKREPPITTPRITRKIHPDGINYILFFDLQYIAFDQQTTFFVPTGDVTMRINGAVVMINPEGKSMFCSFLAYDSKSYKRYIAKKDFESKDRDKYLRQEIDFAVDTIVSKVINKLAETIQK